MSRLVLQFHNWRRTRSDDDWDPIALFHFSLLPEDRYLRGEQPTNEECFWCEASLSRDLAEREGWKHFNRDQKIRILFDHAIESIKSAGRMLRAAPLFWRPGTTLHKEPHRQPSAIAFPNMPPQVIEVGEDLATMTNSARTGAGH